MFYIFAESLLNSGNITLVSNVTCLFGRFGRLGGLKHWEELICNVQDIIVLVTFFI